MKHVYLSVIMTFLFSLAGVAQPCTENAVILNFTTGTWAYEVDFDIISDDGSLVFSFASIVGPSVLNGTTYTFDLCLPDGCYSLNMYDTFGDGWNGAILTVSYNGIMNVVGDLPSGNYGVNSFGINTEGCVAALYGCTDPEALNYNSLANTDDNSCQYPIDCGDGYAAQLYVCAFANGDEIAIDIVNTVDSSIVATIGGLNDGAIQVIDICLDPNVCYEAQMSNAAGNNGWYNGYFWISGAYGQVIYEALDENTNYEAVTFNGGNSVCPNPGCTDPNAINYNPIANVNDGSCVYPEPCDDNSIAINIQTGVFASEISWSISNADTTVFVAGGSYFNGNPPTQFICLPDGCYTLQLYDSFGDGWNGGSIDISEDGVSILNATMLNGSYIAYTLSINSDDCPEIPVLGCTDPLADNYNQTANEDDGSCTYPFFCDSGIASTLYVCTFSNGWQVSFDIVDEAGNIVQSINNLSNGSISYFDLCLDPNQCYTVNMSNAGGATGWNNGYFWINAGNYTVINESLDPNATSEIANFSMTGSCGVLGCTDETAVNFNPTATIEDGSCTYPLTCDEGTYVSIDLNVAAFGSEISWMISGDDFFYSDGSYPSNSSQNFELCLVDGCYTLELFDSFGDGWNGGVMTINGLPGGPITATIQTGEYAVYVIAVGDVECAEPTVYGCTDPQALNYFPYATEDDGSCTYPFVCESGVAAQMYICTFSNGQNVSLAIADEEGNVVFQSPIQGNGSIAYYELCLEPGVCYTAEMTNLAGEIGWYGGYFWINGGGVQYIYDSLDPNATSETASFSIDGSCIYNGCTDPAALNYNANANEDDGSCVYPEPCTANQVYVGLVSGIFPNEISWDIADSNGGIVAIGNGYYGQNGVSTSEICLEDGCYTLNMYDSFGDGWNGGLIYLASADSVFSFEATMENGSYHSVQFGINNDCSIEDIAGCTNPIAVNYDPTATVDDGSCVFGGLPGFMAASLTSFDPTIEYEITPNPVLIHANSRISVRRVPVEDAPIGVDIYDGVGRLVKTQQLGSIAVNSVFDLDIAQLSSGIYFVALTNGGVTKVERLVIE